MLKIREGVEGYLAKSKDALARAGISFVREELSELLCAFRVNLNRDSKAYRQLGMAVLGSFVRALEAIERRNRGEAIKSAPLFPLLRPGPRGGYAEGWSKWFGRYIRSMGISNSARVFHSFRHSFKDALRAGGVGEDLNDALTGHSGGGVGRTYGAKQMVHRFGIRRLTDAVAKVQYRGLDLSHLYVAKAFD